MSLMIVGRRKSSKMLKGRIFAKRKSLELKPHNKSAECAGNASTELPSSTWLPATLLYLFAADCLETSGLPAIAAAVVGKTERER